MFILDGKAEIGNFIFNSLHEVEITKSIEELGDTAIIKMPTSFVIRQNGERKYIEDAIKVGDKVVITLGYQDKYTGVEFRGYVKKISPKIPLEIHCEDAMYHLRRKNITKSWEKTTLKEIVQEVVKDTPVQLSKLMDNQSMPLGKWIIKGLNGAQVLEIIKEKLLQACFIDDEGKLYVGLEKFSNIGQTVDYDLNYNLVENNLEFKTKEDRKIKLKYNYMNPKTNKKESIEVGDSDGEKREYTTSIIPNLKKLEEMAKAELERLKYDGFAGDVTSFLIPFATRGMKAKIKDTEHPNRNGNYFIKKVVTTFGMGGARRKISIGNKL